MPVRKQKSWPALALWVTKRKIHIKAGETIICEGVFCGEICLGNTTFTLLMKFVPRVTCKFIYQNSNSTPPREKKKYSSVWTQESEQSFISSVTILDDLLSKNKSWSERRETEIENENFIFWVQGQPKKKKKKPWHLALVFPTSFFKPFSMLSKAPHCLTFFSKGTQTKLFPTPHPLFSKWSFPRHIWFPLRH